MISIIRFRNNSIWFYYFYEYFGLDQWLLNFTSNKNTILRILTLLSSDPINNVIHNIMTICQYFQRISIRKRFIYVFSATTLITIIASIILI